MDIKVNTMESFTREKKEFIRSNLHHKGPDDQKKKYYHLLKKNQLAIGQRVLDQEREQPQIHQMDLKTTKTNFCEAMQNSWCTCPRNGKTSSWMVQTTTDWTSGQQVLQSTVCPETKQRRGPDCAGLPGFEWLNKDPSLWAAIPSWICARDQPSWKQSIIQAGPRQILLRTNTQEHHLKQMTALGIQIILPKNGIGYREVDYLGFKITDQGITQDQDRLKVIRGGEPPNNIHKVRQFLSLSMLWRITFGTLHCCQLHMSTLAEETVCGAADCYPKTTGLTLRSSRLTHFRTSTGQAKTGPNICRDHFFGWQRPEESKRACSYSHPGRSEWTASYDCLCQPEVGLIREELYSLPVGDAGISLGHGALWQLHQRAAFLTDYQSSSSGETKEAPHQDNWPHQRSNA